MNKVRRALAKDFTKVSSKIQLFVSDYLQSSGAKGLVIGLSGGLDSAVTLHLCTSAIGPKKILCLILPTSLTPEEDILDAVSQASRLNVECKVIPIDSLMSGYETLLPESDDKARGNLTARIRMCILYYFAASRDSLVVGTSDRSELMIGYFSKWGDGGSDLMPIAGLYKTQVRELATHLDIPRQIVEKKSSPRLWPGQFAEEELGASYDTIDPVLFCLVDKKMTPQQAAKKLSLPLKKIRKVESMIRTSAHKRSMPPSARIA